MSPRPASTLLRGAELAEAPVEVPLRPRRAPRPPDPGTPEAALDAARREAEQILAAAHAEAQAAMTAAREQGFAAGLADGMEQAGAAAATLARLCQAMDELTDRLAEDAEREAAVLAVEVASRIVRAEVAARPERVGEVVRGAIRRAADRSALVARVAPADLAACRAAGPRIVEEMGGITRLEIVDDPRLTPGSCVLETPSGDVDATFESQLSRVLEALVAPPDESLVEPAR